MKAEVLTIGDELLRGEIVDSNKAFLSDRLLSLDVETHYHASVRDVPADMIDAFRRAAERSDIVLVSGGLGPTRDDLTSQSLAAAFGREMRLDENALAGIRAFFAAVGREMTENNASQAWFPDGAEVLANPIGTAPGFMLDMKDAIFFCMPGVPREMQPMIDDRVVPLAGRARLGAGVRVRARAHVSDVRHERVGRRRERSPASSPRPKGALAFARAFRRISVRLTVASARADEARARLEELGDRIAGRLGAAIYAEGADATMEQAPSASCCASRSRALTTAESCTGGLIGEPHHERAGQFGLLRRWRCRLPQRSESKTLLGVSRTTLRCSARCARRRRRRWRRERASAPAPTSRSRRPESRARAAARAEKPVGTVAIALAAPGGRTAPSLCSRH